MPKTRLSEFKCPECGEVGTLVADFEDNDRDAIVEVGENELRVIGPVENWSSLRIIRCGNCEFESYTTDEIMEANK